jgi:hypothetical protein
MKKRSDGAEIANELKDGASLFFRSRDVAPKKTQEHAPIVSVDHVQGGTPYPGPERVPRTSPVPPTKRQMRQRQPFDVYQDQYETLKDIAERERAEGLPGSMSRMVREGIDMYLKQRKQKKA